MKKRKLSTVEEKQINIAKLFHKNRYEKGFFWKKFIIAIFVEIIAIILIYSFANHDLIFIAKIAVVFVPVMVWVWFSNFKADKKKSEKILKKIEEIEQTNEVTVTVYECTKALSLGNYEDEGNCYGMEIGNDQMLFWWDYDYSEIGLLPNTKFEVYEDDDLFDIFGKRLTVLGEKFQGIVIKPEIKWDNSDIIPNHKEVISSTVEDFLLKIEQQYKTK